MGDLQPKPWSGALMKHWLYATKINREVRTECEEHEYSLRADLFLFAVESWVQGWVQLEGRFYRKKGAKLRQINESLNGS